MSSREHPAAKKLLSDELIEERREEQRRENEQDAAKLCLARWESGRPYPCVLPKDHDGQHQHPMDPVPTDHFLARSRAA